MLDENVPVFRANKRRKVDIRQARDASGSPEQSAATLKEASLADATHHLPGTGEQDEGEAERLVSALKARHALKKARSVRPVVSSAINAGAKPVESTALSRSTTAAVPSSVAAFDDRFTRPTGVVADVMDQAMTAYIDSRIKDMKVDEERLEQEQQQQQQELHNNPSPTAVQTTVKAKELVAVGRLQEIDLGPAAAQQNLLRTQVATDRLDRIKSNNGIDPAAQPVGRNGKKLKPRKGLGPDGKPWRPRKPRRTSDDMKRDALVESFMSAAPIEVFDNAAAEQSAGMGASADVADKDADERMLEQFQQDYYNAAETSRRARKPPPVKGKEADAVKSSGPRLGGSRSARAAMYKKMQEEALQKKPTT